VDVSTRPILVEQADPRERLATLGLTPEIVRDAVMAGEVHRRRCTRNHPPSYGGYGAWAETVCRLGELLKPEKWTRRDPSNFSIVVNADETVALAVSTGDDRTGREGDPHPRTKYVKGPTVIEAIDRNVIQMELFDTGRRKKVAELPKLTWFLLMVRARGEVRYEVSLPNAVDDEGFVVAWRERIILDPLMFDMDENREPLEPTDEINIDVPAIEE
jgi:hypothetical protein